LLIAVMYTVEEYVPDVSSPIEYISTSYLYKARAMNTFALIRIEIVFNAVTLLLSSIIDY